jgi:hypothetical protein
VGRWVAATAVVVLAALAAVADYRAWEGEQRWLAALARETGALDRFPELLSALRREPHAAFARLGLARALLALELDRRWLADLPEVEREREVERGFARLAVARELALRTLAAQPGAWQAAYVVGGANYLTLSRRGDPALRSNPALWEGLLLRSRELAPEHPEPTRFLAAAYLGNWSGMSAAARTAATSILAEALRNPTTFDLLIPSWLRVAPSLDAALALVPDDPRVWSQLQSLFASRGDLERYRDVTARLDASLEPFIEARLDEAVILLARGAVKEARELIGWQIELLRPSRNHAPIFERALSLLPPGPASGQWLADWIGWAVELAPFGDGPLSRETLERLVGLAPSLDASMRAAAALATGDLVTGERLEREAESADSEAWALYRLLRGQALLERGEPAAAAAALARVTGPWGRSPVAWEARRSAAATTGDEILANQASAVLAGLATTSWPATAWERGRRVQRLTLVPASGSPGLAIDFDVDRDGGVAEVLWDGGRLGFYAVSPGRTLTLRPELGVGAHVLDVVPLLGRSLQPAAARLLPPAP